MPLFVHWKIIISIGKRGEKRKLIKNTVKIQTTTSQRPIINVFDSFVRLFLFAIDVYEYIIWIIIACGSFY